MGQIMSAIQHWREISNILRVLHYYCQLNIKTGSIKSLIPRSRQDPVFRPTVWFIIRFLVEFDAAFNTDQIVKQLYLTRPDPAASVKDFTQTLE